MFDEMLIHVCLNRHHHLLLLDSENTTQEGFGLATKIHVWGLDGERPSQVSAGFQCGS